MLFPEKRRHSLWLGVTISQHNSLLRRRTSRMNYPSRKDLFRFNKQDFEHISEGEINTFKYLNLEK